MRWNLERKRPNLSSDMSKKLLLLLLIGIFLRVININWGSPFYFHPDERNIASAVASIQFPYQMNPHFFAYGSFPIYVIYFMANAFLQYSHTNIFESAIISSRILSSLFSVLTIIAVYFLGKKIGGKHLGLLAASLSVFSIAFIQFAHFGTFEMCLTFFGILYTNYCINVVSSPKTKSIFIAGLLFGLLISTKASSVILIALPFLLFISKNKIFSLAESLLLTAQIATVAFLVYIFTNPFAFTDYFSFRNSMIYESSVAFGTLPVFYTQSFVHTIPVLYQLLNIFPFLLNPIIEFIFLVSFPFFIFKTIKNKSTAEVAVFLSFFLIFFSQAFLFVKWTRYMIPAIPFTLIIVSDFIFNYYIRNKKMGKILILIAIIVSAFYSLSFVKTTYLQPDSRIEASVWASTHFKPSAKFLSEVYDLGITPFNRFFPYISLFNFYDLDNLVGVKLNDFDRNFKQYDFIILPSERISSTRIFDKKDYPLGNYFYTRVFNGTLGFKKIYQTNCDFFCRIVFAQDKVFPLEETTRVFDRPVVMIFQKNEN